MMITKEILRAFDSRKGCRCENLHRTRNRFEEQPGSGLTAEQHENIFACIGVHPHEAAKATDKDFGEIEELSNHPKVVAIGEIGLDYHYDFSPKDRQREIFTAQIKIAVRRNLPLVVHTRESTHDAFAIVQEQ